MSVSSVLKRSNFALTMGSELPCAGLTSGDIIVSSSSSCGAFRHHLTVSGSNPGTNGDS